MKNLIKIAICVIVLGLIVRRTLNDQGPIAHYKTSPKLLQGPLAVLNSLIGKLRYQPVTRVVLKKTPNIKKLDDSKRPVLVPVIGFGDDGSLIYEASNYRKSIRSKLGSI